MDKVLNVDAVTERHGPGTGPYVYDYGYDEVDRLTSALYPTALGLPASESFAYDAAGNREDPSNATAYEYDANNRITASPGRTYSFDADGNIESESLASATQSFTFDKIHRLRAWTDGTTSTSYLYDLSGRRIRKTVGGVTTWYLWDEGHLLAEYDGSGVQAARYAYAGGAAPVQVAHGQSSQQALDVHVDHLDTPRMLSDVSSSPVWRSASAVFGVTSIVASGSDLNTRFPGQYSDNETSLHYNWFRFYDPQVGRYLSQDPLGQFGEGGANLYQYALSNPVNLFDIDGSEPPGGGGERRQTGPGSHRTNPGKKKPSWQPGRGGWGVKDNQTGKFKPLNPQPPAPTDDKPEPWRDHPDYKQSDPEPDPTTGNQNFSPQYPTVLIPTLLIATGFGLCMTGPGCGVGLPTMATGACMLLSPSPGGAHHPGSSPPGL